MFAINSPSHDADQQQDIFWDPHSPTTFNLENGKKKRAANKCAVDISDIVNRIAPKDEKPSSTDAAYLGAWIGDNAIPCTPVVTRDRTKMHRSKILHTEEQLMKLAKQLDNNLVRQKDQNEEQEANYEDEMFGLCNAENNEVNFLENLPEGNDVTLVLKSVSQRSATHRSSQRSVDQDAEAALNALFDSSTQKCSGHLSQGLSDVSTSSEREAPPNVRRNVHDDIGHSKKEESSQKAGTSNPASKMSTNTLQGVKNCSEQTNGKEKETVQSLSSSQDDFEDDWDDDLLKDDSFIMQITQNPELIAPPINSMPHDKPDQINDCAAVGVKFTNISSSFNKTSNYKFMPRKVNGRSEAKPSNQCSTEMTTVRTFHGSSRDTKNAKTFLSTPTLVPSKPQANAGSPMTKNNVHKLVPVTNSTLLKTANKPCAQAASQTRTVDVNKDSANKDDEWDDPKFCSELLESDSLWEWKEDDDILLSEVCDYVEKLSQAQETNVSSPKEGNPKKETPVLSSSTCQALIKPGTNANLQNKYGSPVVAGSSFGSHKFNNRGVSPTSFSGNCLNAYQNSSLQKSNQTFSRSTSVPSGGGCKSTTLPSTPSQNPVKSPAATLSVTNTLAPSKYSFTRIKPSQVPSVHTAQSAAENRSGYNLQNFGDGRKNRDTLVQTNSDNKSKLQQSSLKRHHSVPTVQSSKVFAPENKNKKCSMEEIERKRQEALARRKLKAQTCPNDTTPT
ncbi:hypothetical protein GDO78_010091 [Eleutherodactylus coqui]|nr:hypothetical protein GDO78_010091 [Eleutherodactylus coqui]